MAKRRKQGGERKKEAEEREEAAVRADEAQAECDRTTEDLKALRLEEEEEEEVGIEPATRMSVQISRATREAEKFAAQNVFSRREKLQRYFAEMRKEKKEVETLTGRIADLNIGDERPRGQSGET